MARLTRKKIQVYNLAKPDHKAEYEELLNDPNVSHIIKEEFTYSKRTEHPVITVWYEEFIR
ncbi:MAG: hypothetical protein H8D23_04735 [Candidatus Brocadiales bacterium]|nr:hypothetical protein [Candidatus Brocadiales bacterium]